MLIYFLPPLGRIGIIAGWAFERAIATAWPLNNNSRSPSGESASVSAFPMRRLGRAHGQQPDTVKPGHFFREVRP